MSVMSRVVSMIREGTTARGKPDAVYLTQDECDALVNEMDLSSRVPTPSGLRFNQFTEVKVHGVPVKLMEFVA